ncbi:gephyrin-like molybdotransferase receptor GlpR [Actinokineospora enzanensis]|uniref:divisome protein SepX/GlpR n=1 Tax=Actinokineospora enzanensis TaxID=155975 RepID=UPI00036328FD|nr:gephyrin-like molybdotransferase receptor GlpR [Actinokineospora enzanensis]
MPSSLIVVGLVVAWLVVLVPMVVRKRQEIARTTDTALSARVVRSGAAVDQDAGPAPAEESDGEPEEEFAMAEPEPETPATDPDTRRYRPGRGGYDPEAAARTARAKYGFRQRVVVLMLVAAIATGVGAGLVAPMLWWAHGLLDALLVGYLSYLRRQVRIEEEIRDRRAARMQTTRRSHARPAPEHAYEDDEPVTAMPARAIHPGAVVVELDDEDPWFDELGEPGTPTYRRAVGE